MQYALDSAVTAFEGTNGAGKTTVMIAAYVDLLPDMTRLRFTILGETGATALAFADETFPPSKGVLALNRTTGPAAGVEVALVVEDVAKAFARAVAAGALPVVEPVSKPWGQTVAYVRDLDGFLVELCTAMGK
jgi:catechol 2,3-dioxygenase-like lactoylglutathione lyase family enzyme